MAEMKRYSIGVDPGKETGFAVYDRKEKRLIEVVTLDFWGVVDRMEKEYPPDRVHKLVIELPNGKSVWHKIAKARGAVERTGVNVGSVIREAELLIKRMKESGYNVITPHPLGKVDKNQFKRITGWQGKTNPHARDAGMMCFGM